MRYPGHDEERETMYASIPAGWSWDGINVFNSKAEATQFINERFEEDGHEEAKAIKRGGTTNPHHLVVVRPVGSCTLESPCPACHRRLGATTPDALL